MRRFALLAGLLLSVSALAAVVHTPGPWKLYRGNSFQGDHVTQAACDAAGKALPVAIGRTITFRCAQSTTAKGVADPPAPTDCVFGETQWTEGQFSECANGIRTRTDTGVIPITTWPEHGGQACPASPVTRVITEGCAPPPVDCVVSDPVVTVGTWSACVNGTRTRTDTMTRTVITPPANGGQECPSLVTNVTTTEPCTVEPPPTGELLQSDDFEYLLPRNGLRAEKEAIIKAHGWAGMKDEATQPGKSRGFLHTRTGGPGCGPPPDGSRVLTLEALPYTYTQQTDFYFQYGHLPADVYFQMGLCLNRAGAEMSSVLGTHNKFLYTLYGTRNIWPMSVEEQASLILMYATQFTGSGSVTAPEPGAFMFADMTGPNRARITSQVNSGNGSKMTHNQSDPWLRPNVYYDVRIHIDVSGAQGVYEVELRAEGQSEFRKVAEWIGGVTPGFTWPTQPTDHEGIDGVRIPTTVGPGDCQPTAPQNCTGNYWLDVNYIRIGTSVDAVD